MRLEIFVVTFGLTLLAAVVYRTRMQRSAARQSVIPFTAASITTIEAAFLRGGREGVNEFQRAAAQGGTQHRHTGVDVNELEAALAARGLTLDSRARRNMRAARLTGCALTFPVAVATAVHDAAGGTWSHHVPFATMTEFAILWGGAALGITIVTHIGPRTVQGRRALAMRRAAYPLSLLRDADPAATVALYGGVVRRGTKSAAGGDNDGGFVWFSDAGSSGHGHDGSSGHSHSCASSCGSGGCGGH